MRHTALLPAALTLVPVLAIVLAGCAAPSDRLNGALKSAGFERLAEARLRCTSDATTRLERTLADPYEIAAEATDICAGHEQAMIRLFESDGLRPADYQPLVQCLRSFDLYDIRIHVMALRSNRPGYADTPEPAPDRRFPAREPNCFAGS